MSPSCPICTEPVPPTATECPNCGAALTVESPPAFVVVEEAVAIEKEKPQVAETLVVAEPPHVKTKREKRSERPVAKQKSEPRRESVNLLSQGFPFDLSHPFFCPSCGFGFDDQAQKVCPACLTEIAWGKASIERDIHHTRVKDFVSQFDQEEGLDDSVLAYLYRKHVRPALAEKYEPVAQKWNELFAQGSVAIPGRNVDTKPNLDRLLGGSQAALRLARLWISPEVTHYAVAPEARMEINEYLRDLLCRAYQILGQYHSWRGARASGFQEMEAAYLHAQLMYNKAAELRAKLFPETQALNQSAGELLRMALSYPEKYQKAGKGKNLVTNESAPGYKQDNLAYEEYLTAYSSLQKRIKDLREHLRLVQVSFQENIRELEKRIEDLAEEKTKKSKAIEKELEEYAHVHALAVYHLPAQRTSAQNWAMWAPLIVGLICIVALSLSYLPGITIFGVGLGAVAFSYFQGFSKETFHGQVLPGVQILKWGGALLLGAGLLPLIEEWISVMF